MELKENLDQFTEDLNLRYVAAGLLIVLGLALIAGAELGPIKTDSPENHSGPDNETALTALEINLTLNYSDSIESDILAVENGTTAFQALNKTQGVEYRVSEYGYFITSINNVSGTEEQYWTYTVNNESVNVGAGQYELTESGNVTFTLS